MSDSQFLAEDVNRREEDYENCVGCGLKTFVRKDTHVEARRNYIPGAGQLCTGCASK